MKEKDQRNYSSVHPDSVVGLLFERFLEAFDSEKIRPERRIIVRLASQV